MLAKLTASRIKAHLKQFKRELTARFRSSDVMDERNPRVQMFADKRLALETFKDLRLIVMRDEPVVDLMHFQASCPPDRFLAAIVDVLSKQGTPMIHLDIGVNYGFDLCHTANLVFSRQSDAHVAGFDPGVVRELVPHNLALNDLAGKVSFFPLAMADKPGFLKLYGEQDHSENNRIFNPMKLHTKATLAPATTIDAYVEALDRPKAPIFMKIDTQGAEPEVFAGGAHTLATHPCVIISEFTPWAIGTRHDPAAFLGRLMETHKVYDLRQDRSTCVPVTDAAAFTEEVRTRSETWADILLLPKSAPQIVQAIEERLL